MSVTAHPKYPHHWIIIYYPNGRKKNPATGKPDNTKERIIYGPCTYETAKRYEQELVRSVHAVTASINPTLAETFVQFCGYYQLHVSPTTYGDFTCAWEKWLLPAFGHLRYTQITPEVINAFKTRGLASLKHKTVNKLLSYLSAICTWAARPEINHASHTPKIELFPGKMIQPPPIMVPTPNEIQQLVDAMPKDNRGALATVMYYAGLRLSDANKIRRSQVNIEAGYLVVIGKGMKQRVIPLTPELLAVIEPRLKDDYFEQTGKKGRTWTNKTDYLWPNLRTQRPFIDLQKAINNAANKIGLKKKVTHHMLRHSFCTHMIMAGASTFTVQALAGHSSPQVTQRYVHLATDFLGTEMGRISRVSQNEPPKKEKGVTDEP